MSQQSGAREHVRLQPLLVTKLHPPPWRAQTLARDRLVERLRGGPGTKVTLVAAPAGYGKTTLLGTWRKAEEATRPVAWLSLDEGDNDPVVLWSYVLAALRDAVSDARRDHVARVARSGAHRGHLLAGAAQ